MTDIEIPYCPRYPDVHDKLDRARFAVLVAHRRFGKTVLAVNHLLKEAILCDKQRGSYAYVAPLRNQAKIVAWDFLKHYSQPVPKRQVNEAELCITIPNACGSTSRLRIFGADNPDALRGAYYDCIVLDEVAQMKPEVWQEVVRPALSDRKGSAIFIGTPKGINLFSELYETAVQEQSKGNADWYAASFPVTVSNAIDPDEVKRLRNEMSENAFKQEYLCDFNASSDNILIPLELVKEAMQRNPREHEWSGAPLVFGVDVARFGDDRSVLFARQGIYAHKPMVFTKLDNMELADRIAGEISRRRPAAVFIDAGGGAGVIDRLRQLGHQVMEVPFGAKPVQQARFVNRRMEMWQGMADWIRGGGALPPDEALKGELSAPTYFFNTSGLLQLERKEDVKERLLRSPDCFAAGTMVATPLGNVPIEKIAVGDKVITPMGIRTVIKTWEVDASEISTAYFSNGKKLCGKNKHRVYAAVKGWVRLDALAMVNGIETFNLWSFLQWNILSSLFTEERNLGFKQLADTINPGTRKRKRDYYTGASGLTSAGLFLTAIRCIIKTATGLITGLKIWSLWKAASITRCTWRRICQTLNIAGMLLQRWIKRKEKQQNGTDRKRAESGTLSTAENRGKGENQKKRFVLCVGRNTKHFSRHALAFAPGLASNVKDTSGASSHMECVRCVASRLFSTSTKCRSVVPERALSDTGLVKVYNLTLDADNVYYANGILVENCADALALTFAAPVAPVTFRAAAKKPYDPMEWWK